MHLAFYGAGAIAERHIDAIRRTGDLDVTWLVSRTAAHAEALASKKRIARWTTETALPLDDPDIQGVVIAYPSFLHADLVVQAMERGKHVICEKPLASDIGDVERVLAKASETNRLLLVTQIRRFWPVFTLAHQFVQEDRAGALARVTADFQTEWDWSNRGWRLDDPGGYLLDMHVHDIDLLLWLAGRPPERIWACGENAANREGTVTMDFGTAYGRLDWSGRISGRPYPTGARTIYQIACARGRMDIEIADTVRWTIVVAGDRVDEGQTAVSEQIRASWDAMWRDQAAALLGQGPIPVPASEAAENVRVTLAAVAALRRPAGKEL